MTWTKALGVAALSLFLSGCVKSSSPPAESEFASKVKSTFGLSLPCSLAWCDWHPGWESVGGVLVGAQGDSLPWAWGPGTTPVPVPPEAIARDTKAMSAWGDSVLQSSRRRAFIGATHFSSPDAKPLTIGSPEESLFVRLLWTTVERDSVAMSKHGPQGKGLMAAYVVRMLETQRARVGKDSTPTPGDAK